MDFKDQIKQIAERVSKMKDGLQTEEATKNALIMPFLQSLGYDVFNPNEVVPEYTCDIGTKKGEKIDYAIMKDNQPIILIECKHVAEDLNLHDNQLLRYFNVSKAYFGILTNGVVYRFYTDLAKENIMDEKPFLEINMLDLKEPQIEDLKKFHKSYFDIEAVWSSASELKYTSELKARVAAEFSAPSNELVKCLCKGVYEGIFTTKVYDQFTPLVKRSIESFISDIISNRLKAAIEKENEPKTEVLPETQPEQEKIYETTEIELNGYYIVKSILRNIVSPERIIYKDNKDYFAVNIDSVVKNVCRFKFNNPENLRIEFKDDTRVKITSLDEIYNYSDKLVETAQKYL
jgi:hypothetical protein